MSEQQQLQQKPGSHQRLNDDTSYYGAALGHTGTSTRQELTAWLRVLAIPCRSLYATDSASMMSKALKLIEAAGKFTREKLSGNDRKRGNPFGKASGLQVDGDLWEQAWHAVLRGGSGNQSRRKVKGHATEKDIENGRSNPEDKEGNDFSDKLAGKGVEAVVGIGLVKLGNGWKLGRKTTGRSSTGCIR